MKIAKESRQIPDSKKYCANNKYYDILYSYLQYISYKVDTDNPQVKRRFVDEKDINFSQLALKFDVSRQTVSTRFKNLIQLDLIEYDKPHKRYELLRLEKDDAALIPYTTLQVLVDTLNKNTISAYVYLMNRYIANGEKPFVFTLTQIKDFIGISTTTRSNDNIITNILYVLQKIGLIKYELTGEKQTGSFDNIKTIYKITELTNELC